MKFDENIVLVFAYYKEAEFFIKNMDFEKVESKPFQVYSNNKVKLVISGEGYLRASAAVQHTILNYNTEYVINMGFSGALQKDIEVGEIFSIGKSINLVEWNPIKTPSIYMFSKIENISNLKKCVTSPFPIIGENDRRKIQNYGDIVDMELAGIAKICSLYKKEIFSIKIVSDNSQKDISNFKEISGELSEKLFLFFEENILFRGVKD